MSSATDGILFLKNYAQWQDVQRHYPRIARSYLPVTFDIKVVGEHERLGRPIVELSDYVTASAHEAFSNLASTLTNTWFQPYLGHVFHHGVNLAELMKYDMFLAFRACLWLEVAFKKVLADFHPPKVAVYADLSNPHHHDGDSDSDIPAAILLWLADKFRSRQVLLQMSGGVSDGNSSRAFVPESLWCNPNTGVVEAIPRPTGSSRRSGRERDYSTFINTNTSNTILSLSGGVDFVNQTRLRSALRQEGYRVITVAWACSMRPDPLADHLDFTPFLELPFDHIDLKNLVEKAWNHFKSCRISYNGDNLNIFSNPYLEFQFRSFFLRIVEGARWFDAARAVADLFQPTLCLTGADAWGLRRCVVKALKTRGVLTVQRNHAPIVDFDIYRFISDYLLVPGRVHQQEHVARSRPAERLLIAGDPNFLLVNHRLIPSMTKCSDGRKSLLAFSVLLNAGFDTPNDMKMHRETWRKLAIFAQSRSDVEILIKPHPRFDYYDFYDLLSCQFAALSIVNKALKPCDILPQADVVVLMNGATSAAIEAMAYQKPVVYIVTALRWKDAPTKILLQSGAAIVRTLEELPDVLDELLSDEVKRARVISAQNSFLREYISITGEEAATAETKAVISLFRSAKAREPFPNDLISRAVWKNLVSEEVSENLKEPSNSRIHKGGERDHLIRWLISWLSLWAWQIGPTLSSDKVIKSAMEYLDSTDHLSFKSRLNLTSQIHRLEAMRCRYYGDVSGMRKHAVKAIVRRNPLRNNLDLSHILLESIFGSIPEGFVKLLKKFLTACNSTLRYSRWR